MTKTEPRPYIPFFPDGHYFLELRRPWKLATLSVGMLWLLFGALFYHISDWDVGISLIMGGLTYLPRPLKRHHHSHRPPLRR